MVLLMRSLAVRRQHTKPGGAISQGNFQALPTDKHTSARDQEQLDVGRDRDMPEIGFDT